MASIFEEIVDEQMEFIEKAGQYLAELGQDNINAAAALDEAFWSFIASLVGGDSKSEE